MIHILKYYSPIVSCTELVFKGMAMQRELERMSREMDSWLEEELQTDGGKAVRTAALIRIKSSPGLYND